MKQILPILVAVLCVSVALPQASANDNRKPNIVFLFVDAQRPDTIAALGNANIQTPNLDRFA